MQRHQGVYYIQASLLLPSLNNTSVLQLTNLLLTNVSFSLSVLLLKGHMNTKVNTDRDARLPSLNNTPDLKLNHLSTNPTFSLSVI